LGRLGDILHAPVKVDLSASDGKDQRDARDESRQIKPNQTESNQIKPDQACEGKTRLKVEG
jgi:hypothetical protein